MIIVVKAVSLFYYNYFLCISSHSKFWTAFCITILIFYNSVSWDVPPGWNKRGSSSFFLTPHLFILVRKYYYFYCPSWPTSTLFFWIINLVSLGKKISILDQYCTNYTYTQNTGKSNPHYMLGFLSVYGNQLSILSIIHDQQKIWLMSLFLWK